MQILSYISRDFCVGGKRLPYKSDIGLVIMVFGHALIKKW